MRGRFALVALLAGGAILAGCGAEEFANDPRPPTTIELSARVNDRDVVIVPDEVGAGLATITISNQSADDVQLSFEGPPGARNPRSREIAAGESGSVQFLLETGDYAVEPSVATISPGAIEVGELRESAKDDLLLP